MNCESQVRDELYHHGVIGMKWGVRKERQRTPSDAVVVRKGSIIRRLSTVDNETHEGKAFATFETKDAVGYMRRSMALRQKSFSMEMRATEDLISPSKKARVDAFMELMKNDEFFAQNLSEVSSKTRIFKSSEAIQKTYSKMTDDQLRSKAYSDLALALATDEKGKVRDAYFKKLTEKGYNMVVDDMDAQLLARNPIVVFDRGKSLEVLSTKLVTNELIKELESRD